MKSLKLYLISAILIIGAAISLEGCVYLPNSLNNRSNFAETCEEETTKYPVEYDDRVVAPITIKIPLGNFIIKLSPRKD